MDDTLLPGLPYSHEKDARFDGHFFRAILTTGIFCRPICPSRPARAENVLFFSTAAAAAEAGFRPCLRCRPESAPDRPDGVGVSRLVRQALRLIATGVASDELPARLHISSRQLRRRFVQELGTPPVAVSQTRRLLFAKKLIDETDLPMTDLAFAAGYGSVRRFNAAIQQTYGRTPSAIRQSRRQGTVASEPGQLTLKLFYRPPYDWRAIWDYLALRATPGVEELTATSYRRLVVMAEASGVIELTPFPEENFLRLQLPASLSRHLLVITERLKRLFDLRADPALSGAVLDHDPLLAQIMADRPGIRLPGAWDEFEVAVRIILGQQVSVKGATTLTGRLVSQFGSHHPQPDEATLAWQFPTPAQLVNGDIASIGLPQKRAETIRALAAAVLAGELEWHRPEELAATEARLTALPGVGPWTAQMIAMRALGESDAFPAGDLVL
ncbi:MAG: DNA-3-methyladenine glycosylase 2 family protein, partial [Anaerolineales bacterium]|nr:DNA-3-methyladenine glycosylase 2 family protein [Anaerolineales bacterium]